jgi:hypothetical protein
LIKRQHVPWDTLACGSFAKLLQEVVERCSGDVVSDGSSFIVCIRFSKPRSREMGFNLASFVLACAEDHALLAVLRWGGLAPSIGQPAADKPPERPLCDIRGGSVVSSR